MTVAAVRSRALAGAAAPPVLVEVHLAGGLPAFHLVGLPEAEVRESRDRVRAALQNARFEFPQRKVTVNLAPADLPKESGRFDLPIALGILAASGQIPQAALERHEFAGELALSGDLRPVRGALAMVLAARGDGRAFVLPAASRGRGGAGPRCGRASGARAARGVRAPRRNGAAARRADAHGIARPARRRPTSPTCAGRRTPSARSRSRRRAATRCC